MTVEKHMNSERMRAATIAEKIKDITVSGRERERKRHRENERNVK